MHVTRAAVRRHGIVPLPDRVVHGPLGIELLALLIVVGDLHVRAAPHFTLIRRQLADDHPQQRRFARSVRTDEADAIAAHDARREIADDGNRLGRIRHRAGRISL